MVPLSAYVAVSAVLFMTGLLGVLIRRNFIIVLMSVEIMMNAANINLVAFSHYLESMSGQLVALFNIAIAAGEAAVGLAIIVVVFGSPHQADSAPPAPRRHREWASREPLLA
jgi:NADH-quinone oxidoreductase subunit K